MKLITRNKNIVGDEEILKRVARAIRPYRHVYIRILKPASGSVSYEIVNGTNEFGSGLISTVGDGTGSYSISLNTALFHNVDNVTQEADITHTTSTNDLLLTSLFFDETKSVLNISVFNQSTVLPVDIDGEIMVIIKEFYE